MYDKIRHIIAYMLCYIVCLSSVYGHSDYDVSNDADPVVTILFIAFGLGIGILIQQVLSKLGDPVPYTVVVFIAGLVFSSWTRDNAGMYVGHRLCVISMMSDQAAVAAVTVTIAILQTLTAL